LAEELAKSLRGGEVIEMIGDLGAGKTTFVRGLTRGLGCVVNVTSPTFSLMNTYSSGRLSVNHFDLYRLEDIGAVRHEIEEATSHPENVTIIEWAKQIDYIKDLIKIRIDLDADEQNRKIHFLVPKKFEYLKKSLENK